ncbi:MAG: DHH family phosphoesterase [candidate division WOR-3 bacterium]|nr:MAG: DHH family phosphoesterase [candidate division WOR-3 bacterium]
MEIEGQRDMNQSIDNDRILAQKYASDFSIPLELAQIVAQRFPMYGDAKKFLFPELSHLHEPGSIPDMTKATEEILKSIRAGEGILIYSHDDVDGHTSAAIMYQTLIDLYRQEHCPVYVYSIIREKDGYTLNPDVLREYKRKGVKLILTVDFGISNAANFRVAEQEGLKLVVCDHHETSSRDFPVPAVNPKRADSRYPFRELAGVGVTFKLAQSLYQTAFNLTTEEFCHLKKIFFPAVLIGTLSDRVLLREENRLFCVHGLNVVQKIDEPWVRFFGKHEGIDITTVTSEIIPILASATYVDPNLGVGILVSRDEAYIAEAVARLKLAGAERTDAVELLFRETLAAAKIFPNVVIAVIPFSRQQHLGPVSSRLREYFKRTSVVIGLQNEKCYGELRSYRGNLYEMLYSLSELFLNFGGHQKAAGFSMCRENLDTFIERVLMYVEDRGDEVLNATVPPPEVFLNRADISVLSPLMPFGEGNPAPVLTDGVSVYTIDNKFNIIEHGVYGKP